MGIIDKIKYYFFFHRLNKEINRIKLINFETENYKIFVNWFLIKTIIVELKNKDIEYIFSEVEFRVIVNDEELSSDLIKFDKVFWNILKEIKQRI